MRNFISEDDIEQAILKKVKATPFCYDIVKCASSPDKREALADARSPQKRDTRGNGYFSSE